MARRSSKSAIIRLARKHEIYGFFSWEGIGSVEEMESIQAPVEAIEAEVFGEPVFELISTLRGVGSENELVGEHELCLGFGYISRAARWRVAVHLGEQSLLLDQVRMQETCLNIGEEEVLGSKMEMSDEVACGIVPQFRKRIGTFISLVQLRHLHKALDENHMHM